jgi:pyruvate dehydrogenase E1 component alpha subunit
MMMHTTADDPKRYRTEEEVEEWKKRDPIDRFQKYLKDKDLLSDETIESLEAEIKTEIQAAVDEAEKQMKTLGDPLGMFENVYADMPAYLKEQREELAQELSESREEGNHG